MNKISLFGGTPEIQGGASYEWGSQTNSNSFGPIMEIVGTGGNIYAKETNGPVRITGNGSRTVVRVVGSGGWKITGPEEISG